MLARLALACAALCLAPAALAQSSVAVDRARGLPVGLTVPATVAGADEPTAVAVNPAGFGFVDGLTLQYAFEGFREGFTGNGLYLAAPLGPLVPGLTLEWVSPSGAPRYLKTTLALGLGFGQAFSLGYAWAFYSSPDPAWGDLFSMDAGLTWRPFRFLSLGASALGMQARLAGQSLPVRFAFGSALRYRDGLLQLEVDLNADDQGRGAFITRSLATTLSMNLSFGLTLQAQALFPLRESEGPLGSNVYQLAVGLEQPHFGARFSANAVDEPGSRESSSLVGLRLSTRRYGHSMFGRIQALDLARELERPSPILILLGAEPDPYGALLARLREIRDDPSASALVVRIGDLPLREGRIEELREALLSVRETKPVYAFLAGGGTREYWLATAAREVLIPPASVVTLNGLASTRVFLREGLGRLGVAFEAVALGRFKSAPEALTRSGPSEAQREVVASLLDDRFARLVRGVAEARKLPEPRVRELVDQGIFTAEEARQQGLVDATLWPDEVEARLRAQGVGGMMASRLDSTERRGAERWGPRPAVAVIRIEGAIAPGKSRIDFFGGGIAGAESVTRAIAAAAEDGSVKAIVLRLESPGGDGFASAEIWRGVREARRRGKPVVASMGDVAASGAYLVASGADAVVAEPSTLTGSIGVFALKADLSGLLQKLGVALYSDQRGEKARIDSPLKPWTPEERRLLERQVESFYQQFVEAVAEGRALPRQEVERSAQGRVWSGAQALERKLVDRLGSLDEAVALAERRAGLAPGEAVLRRVDPRRGFPDELAAGLASVGAEAEPLRALGAKLPEVRAASLLSEMGPVLALPPEWLGQATGD
ncbi:MAG TPA: signal peptide peptidase SppA [Anaeromyxobacteraceae bacterium]|nr:signal peptide peptidase SppA [Anaeromyxobacteraceae bacterium]